MKKVRRRLSVVLANLPFYLVATLVVLPFVLPLVWMVAGSLRAPGLPPPRGVEWIPQPLTWQNYRSMFELVPLGRYALNSLLISCLGMIITFVVASWAGFGMAQLGPQFRRCMLVLAVGLLMIPLTTLWLTRFLIFNALGWLNTYLALLAPALMGSSSLFVLLFYWAFRRVPAEHYEAARLDGAGLLRVWARVGLPQIRPTIATVAVLTFIFYWNDFINPLIYLKSQRLYTLAIGLQQFQQLDRTNWPLLLAASVVMTAPVIVLFLLVQRYFLQE